MHHMRLILRAKLPDSVPVVLAYEGALKQSAVTQAPVCPLFNLCTVTTSEHIVG